MTVTPTLDAPAPAGSPRARRRRLLRERFLRRPMAVAGLVVALAFVLVAVFAPLVAPYGPDATDFNAILEQPSWRAPARHRRARPRRASRGHLRRARVDPWRACFATLLAMVIAVPIGLLAGYYRGWIDPVIARVTDVLLAFPFLILAVGLAAILGPSLPTRRSRSASRPIPALIRIARGETLALREEDYVRAAVANGAGDARILRPPHPAEHDGHADRAGDGADPGGDHRRGRRSRSSASASSRRRPPGA